MRLNALATVLIATAVLSGASSCGTTRKASSSESLEFRVESLELRDSSDVERISVLDTLKEVTTITVQVNETGDTLRQSIVTDRLRSRDRSLVRDKSVEVKILHDTVYIERTDSVLVQSSKFQVQSGSLNPRPSSLILTLRWIFAIICAMIALVITVKLIWRRGS